MHYICEKLCKFFSASERLLIHNSSQGTTQMFQWSDSEINLNHGVEDIPKRTALPHNYFPFYRLKKEWKKMPRWDFRLIQQTERSQGCTTLGHPGGQPDFLWEFHFSLHYTPNTPLSPSLPVTIFPISSKSHLPCWIKWIQSESW